MYFKSLYKGNQIPFMLQETFFKNIFVCKWLIHNNSYFYVSI